jgi:hypothetical protein
MDSRLVESIPREGVAALRDGRLRQREKHENREHSHIAP